MIFKMEFKLKALFEFPKGELFISFINSEDSSLNLGNLRIDGYTCGKYIFKYRKKAVNNALNLSSGKDIQSQYKIEKANELAKRRGIVYFYDLH